MEKNPKERPIHLDEFLSKFGMFSPYQFRVIFLLAFSFYNNSMHCINFMFVAENLPYRCRIDQCESPDEVFSVPWYNFTTPPDYGICNKYATINDTGCSPVNFNVSVPEPCTDWVYSVSNSFASEFQLACQDWKLTFVGTIHSIGTMIGLFFQGQISDKIGRKATIIISGIAACTFGFAKSFSTSYLMFILLEFLEATLGDNCSPTFIMSVELVHGNDRIQQLVFLVLISAMGGVSMAVIAYNLPYWRHFIRGIYAPSLCFLLYYFFMDESIRWLLSKGEKKKATKILLKMAKQNNVELDSNMVANLQCEEKGANNSPLRDTFRSKIVIKRFIVCLIWWITCTFVCFGLIINSLSLVGNKYLNFGVLSLIDIPASYAVVITLKRFNRKKPLLISFMLAGTLCIIQPFVPKRLVWLSSGLYFMGKFLTIFMFTTVYVYTSEIFPTYARNSMHALCSSIGRIGSIVAPMTPLLIQYMESLPTLLFGGMSLFAGFMTFLVPDVSNDTLPDNVQQAEAIGSGPIALNNISANLKSTNKTSEQQIK